MKTFKKTKQVDLTQGSVRYQLFHLAYPMVIGIAANMSFNLVDTYFIARLGSDELAAVGFCFPVVFLLFNLSIGTSIGVSSLISRQLGRGDGELARRTAGDSILYGILLYGLVNLLVYFNRESLFQLLGADREVMPFVLAYMGFLIPAMFLRSLAVDMSGVFRGFGSTKVPSRLILITAGVNLVLDPIMIFGWGPVPPMGVQGAALATFLANIIGTSVAAYWLFFQNGFARIQIQSLSSWLSSVRRIAHIALPAALSNALNPVAIGFVTYLLATLGNSFVAGYSVGVRIFTFGMIPLFALSAGTGPFIGQNEGAGRVDRILSALRNGYSLAVLWAFFLWIGLFLCSDFLARIFVKEELVAQTLSTYLKIVPFGVAGYGAVVVTSSAFNAVGRPFLAFLCIFLRTIFVWLPATWIGLQLFKAPGLYSGELFSNLIAGTASLLLGLFFFQSQLPGPQKTEFHKNRQNKADRN